MKSDWGPTGLGDKVGQEGCSYSGGVIEQGSLVGLGFPGGSAVKNPPANAGSVCSIPGSGKFPCRRKWQTTPVFLPGKSHSQRSLAGSSPWGCKESGTTQWLNNSNKLTGLSRPVIFKPLCTRYSGNLVKMQIPAVDLEWGPGILHFKELVSDAHASGSGEILWVQGSHQMLRKGAFSVGSECENRKPVDLPHRGSSKVKTFLAF